MSSLESTPSKVVALIVFIGAGFFLARLSSPPETPKMPGVSPVEKIKLPIIEKSIPQEPVMVEESPVEESPEVEEESWE